MQGDQLKLGKLALEAGLISREQLNECIARWESQQGPTRKKLGTILIEAGYLTPDDLQTLLERQARDFRRVIEGYELLSKIGQGAMGSVYKARQLSMDKIVAVKILSPHLTKDRKFVMRFLKEARATGKLDHPNIVRAIDVGVSGSQYFYSMEYIEGETLADAISRKSKFSEGEALRIVRDAARGLHHAHMNGFVHRDVKPSNIFITSEGTVKVADFGLVKDVHSEGSQLTMSGTVVGTPHYMAPEQAQAGDVDCRADVYSLGIVLYQLITGQLPFTGSTVVAIMTKHVSEPLVPPEEVNPEISKGTSFIVQKMLAKNLDHRYQNMGEVIADIDAHLEHKLVKTFKRPATRYGSALRHSALTAGRLLGRRYTHRVYAPLVGVALLGGILLLFIWLLGRPDNAERNANRELPGEKAPALESRTSSVDEERATTLLKYAERFATSIPRADSDDILKKYEDVVEKFPGTAAASEAAKKIHALDEEIKTAEEMFSKARQSFQAGQWDVARDTLLKLIDAYRWVRSIREREEDILEMLGACFSSLTGRQAGLIGEYFDGPEFNIPRLVRTDATIDFRWGMDAPAANVYNNGFSVRWTGFIYAPWDTEYVFEMISDDGVRLFINDEQLISNWTNRSETKDRCSVKLSPGFHTIKVEYYDYTNDATIRMLWKAEGVMEEFDRVNPCLLFHDGAVLDEKRSRTVPRMSVSKRRIVKALVLPDQQNLHWTCDFSQPSIQHDGNTEVYHLGCRHTRTPGRPDWFLIFMGQGAGLAFVFELSESPEKVVLILRHLTSTVSDANGNIIREESYSPVHIFVNDTLIAENFDPLRNGGGGSLINHSWDITSFCRKGRNFISVIAGPLKTHYWLQKIAISTGSDSE